MAPDIGYYGGYYGGYYDYPLPDSHFYYPGYPNWWRWSWWQPSWRTEIVYDIPFVVVPVGEEVILINEGLACFNWYGLMYCAPVEQVTFLWE